MQEPGKWSCAGERAMTRRSRVDGDDVACIQNGGSMRGANCSTTRDLIARLYARGRSDVGCRLQAVQAVSAAARYGHHGLTSRHLPWDSTRPTKSMKVHIAGIDHAT